MSDNTIVVKRKCKVVFDFEAKEDDHISVSVGQVIYITDDTKEEWWKGILAKTRYLNLRQNENFRPTKPGSKATYQQNM
jgi:tyrosine-protein phosphatase YwqE